MEVRGLIRVASPMRKDWVYQRREERLDPTLVHKRKPLELQRCWTRQPTPTPTIPLPPTRGFLFPRQYLYYLQLQHRASQNALGMPTPSSTLSRKRTRNCGTAGCKDPSNCPYRSNRNNCILLTGGDTRNNKKNYKERDLANSVLAMEKI